MNHRTHEQSSGTAPTVALPPAVGEQLQTAFGLPAPPRTVAEWVRSTATVVENNDVRVGLDALCTAETARHEATVDGEVRHYRCVLDALALPFLLDADDPVSIRSEAPLTGRVVEIEAGQDALTVDPAAAVVSFGAATGIEPPDADDIDVTLAYERFCPYANAFPSRAAYDDWAAQADAETVAVPVDRAHQVIRDVLVPLVAAD